MLKELAAELDKEARKIRDKALNLNRACWELNGTAATVPETAGYPLGAFAGKKVILHNVTFEAEAGGIYGAIKVPYEDSPERGLSGQTLRFRIDDTWF